MSTFYDIPKEIEQTDDIIPIITFDDMKHKKVKVLYVDGTKKVYNNWIDSGKPVASSGDFKGILKTSKTSNRYLVCVRNRFGNIGNDITLHLSDSTKIKCRIASHISQKISGVKNANKLFENAIKYPIDEDITKNSIIHKDVFVCLFVASSHEIKPLKKGIVVKSIENESITKQSDQTQTKLQETRQRAAELALTKQVMFHPSDGSSSPKRTDKWYSYPNNPFPYNSSSGGNCTWYAYGRFCEIANEWVKMSSYPNAVFFYDSFPNCKKGSTPKLGAIACWGRGYDRGEPGHVAVVEKVYSNGDCDVTESGWTGGWHKGLHKLKKENNYCNGWTSSGYSFRGFIYNPIEFDDLGVAIGVDNGSISIDMQKRIETLYSSDNYSYLEVLAGAKKESPLQPLINVLKNEVKKVIEDEKIFGSKLKKKVEDAVLVLKSVTVVNGELNRERNSSFEMAKDLVEAPVVTVKIGDIVIGSAKDQLDKYPNYINRLTVRKTNGQLNEYKLEIIHQIRVGDDPQLLDKVFAKNGFTPITISYGDSTTGLMFEDINAIITNVSMIRDYSSAKISYGVEATSACTYITAHKMNFPAKFDKPSNVLINLFYHSSMSNELKKAFPGMASKNEVTSKGWIPTNDKPIQLKAHINTDPITYINYLVSSMSNSNNTGTLNKSSYFIFYKDNGNGAGFEIKEISSTTTSNKFNSIYEITVGYPYGDNKNSFNNVYSFDVTNDKSWAILYDKTLAANKENEYIYTITDNGDVNKYYSPNIINSVNVMTERNRNWWSFMLGFPITATLTIRGLLRPAFLTDYIKINVVFYGQKHITSGIYAITEQVDTLSGSGFRTTFSLIRVGEN